MAEWEDWRKALKEGKAAGAIWKRHRAGRTPTE
jgi:hypothetical protein